MNRTKHFPQLLMAVVILEREDPDIKRQWDHGHDSWIYKNIRGGGGPVCFKYQNPLLLPNLRQEDKLQRAVWRWEHLSYFCLCLCPCVNIELIHITHKASKYQISPTWDKEANYKKLVEDRNICLCADYSHGEMELSCTNQNSDQKWGCHQDWPYGASLHVSAKVKGESCFIMFCRYEIRRILD